jgi:hypothetical protein
MNTGRVSPLESIPDTESVRCMLAQKLREAGILRQLLKAAEKKEKADGLRTMSHVVQGGIDGR